MGLNATLQTAGRSLEIFSTGIGVAGQNIANANNPNYVQERLNLTTDSPYQQGQLLIGTGARALGIQQVLDYNLEQQIHAANSDSAGATVRTGAYDQLQVILSELGDGDLSTRMNEFLGSINELVNQPELQANRHVVLQQGEQLADALVFMRQQINRAQSGYDDTVHGLVTEANALIEEIASLNTRIVRLELGGVLQSEAGGLRTQRLTALNRLSEIMPIRTTEHANGVIDVFSGTDYLSGSEFLVLNDNLQLLESQPIVGQEVSFAKTGAPLSTTNGELGAAIDARNNVLGGFVTELDQYTQALIQEMNRIHASGEGLKGYETVIGTYGVDDSAAVLNQAGLAATPTHGSFEIKIYDQATETTTTTRVSIDLDGLNGNDTTLDDLQATLDGITYLNATIDHLGRLSLSTDQGYDVRFSNDTSGTLAALGINTFFDGSDSSNIQVNSTLLGDPLLLAAGYGDGPGDNRNAIELAQFMENPIELLNDQSLDSFYETVTAQLATAAAAENSLADGFESFQQSLVNLRQQNSGVSLDEEAINLMQLQQSYAAAARIVSTVDELMNILLNI